MSTGWRAVVVLASVLAVAAVGAAAWFGYSWWGAAHDPTARTVAARDEALSAVRRLAVILQTVDAQHPEQSMASWQASATGKLLDKLRREQNKFIGQLKKTPTATRTTVLDAALTAVDPDAGTATAIVALQEDQIVMVNGQPGAPTQRRVRIKLDLDRTDDGWKVASSSLINA
jgi:Mce-associated membrane protein